MQQHSEEYQAIAQNLKSQALLSGVTMYFNINCRWMASFILLILCIITFHTDASKIDEHHRALSASNDAITGENIRTINGKVPEVSCPLGHYRPPGSTDTKRVSGQRQDGCNPCPRGRYGDQMGLDTASCTAACPVGTYGDKEGLESVSQCEKCPPGTFGIYRGMKTKTCSGMCPKGKYSDTYGASGCKVCPPHYHDWQCSKDIDK